MSRRGTGADVNSVGDYGKGFYFTPSKKLATRYAKKVGHIRGDLEVIKPTLYTVELTMDKPFDMRLITDIRRKTLELM